MNVTRSPLLPRTRGPRVVSSCMLGVTLLELVTVLTILAIIAVIAAPSFGNILAAQKSKTIASDLNLALSVARSEAVKRNANAALCPKTSGGSGWVNGWQVQASSDCAALVPISNAAQVHGAVTQATISGPTGVVYQGTGRVEGTTAPVFTVTASVASFSAVRYVCTDLGGRPMIKDATC